MAVMPRRSSMLVAVAIVLLAIGITLAYRLLKAPYAVERDDRIAMTRVVTATFGKLSALRVGTLSGTVQATAADARLGGLLQSDSVIRAPYTVDYSIDLTRMTPADYAWNPATRTLTMRVPDVSAGVPNIDEARMTVTRRGVFITRDALDAMSRAASRRATAIAAEKAASPEMMAKARANAREALARLLRAPLAAAGMGDVRVIVRLPADGNKGVEPWDESRSLDEIYRRK